MFNEKILVKVIKFSNTDQTGSDAQLALKASEAILHKLRADFSKPILKDGHNVLEALDTVTFTADISSKQEYEMGVYSQKDKKEAEGTFNITIAKKMHFKMMEITDSKNTKEQQAPTVIFTIRSSSSNFPAVMPLKTGSMVYIQINDVEANQMDLEGGK